MNATERKRVFCNWISNYQGLLFKVVRAYAFTASDRDDLLQEISYQLWESIPRFRAESSATTWIYRVALYAGMSWSRNEQKHSEQRVSFEDSEVLLMRDAQDPDPRLEWLYAQIARLEPLDRSLTLLLLDGFSYREISATLGISASHVGVKIHRIKKSLASRSASEARHGV